MAEKDQEKTQPEQETQHQKQQDATGDSPVDPSDADEGIEQETQSVKRAAAQQSGEERNRDDSG